MGLHTFWFSGNEIFLFDAELEILKEYFKEDFDKFFKRTREG
jgi:hypothetical protein